MLVSKSVRRIELPHESGAWIEVRQLSFAELAAARDVQSRTALRRIEGLDFTKLRDLQQQVGVSNGEIGETDPLAAFDELTLLEAGIVAWSYEEPVTPENVRLLDEATAEVAARAIVGVGDPLAQTKKGR